MSNQKKLILIADDDADYLFQMEAMVRNLGFDVKTADGQHEAERLLDTIKPDLAIFDLMMENEDSGFLLAYKAKRKFPDMPIIIASAATAETGFSFDMHNTDDRNWIKADLYLEKGIRSDQLHREINKLLKL